MSFTLTKQVINFQDTLYIIKRTVRETSFNVEDANKWKEYFGCDTVLKKDGVFYFVNKIDEAQIVEDSPLELDTPKES